MKVLRVLVACLVIGFSLTVFAQGENAEEYSKNKLQDLSPIPKEIEKLIPSYIRCSTRRDYERTSMNYGVFAVMEPVKIVGYLPTQSPRDPGQTIFEVKTHYLTCEANEDITQFHWVKVDNPDEMYIHRRIRLGDGRVEDVGNVAWDRFVTVVDENTNSQRVMTRKFKSKVINGTRVEKFKRSSFFGGMTKGHPKLKNRYDYRKLAPGEVITYVTELSFSEEAYFTKDPTKEHYLKRKCWMKGSRCYYRQTQKFKVRVTNQGYQLFNLDDPI